jgi:hypothetical protein
MEARLRRACLFKKGVVAPLQRVFKGIGNRIGALHLPV